jgi:hypothetical protein
VKSRSIFVNAALSALYFAVSIQVEAQPERIIVHPRDNGRALVNPGMGWIFHNYDNNITTYTVDLAPSDVVQDFPGVSVVYMRLAWSYLEPQEGRYNWAILDTAMQKWVQAGKQVAFRFTASESGQEAGEFAMPRWVMEERAKGYFIKDGGIASSGPEWEPDFNDPIYLAKLDDLLAMAAARYDGNPDFAFVDVAFGEWGEGHTVTTTGVPTTWRLLLMETMGIGATAWARLRSRSEGGT